MDSLVPYAVAVIVSFLASVAPSLHLPAAGGWATGWRWPRRPADPLPRRGPRGPPARRSRSSSSPRWPSVSGRCSRSSAGTARRCDGLRPADRLARLHRDRCPSCSGPPWHRSRARAPCDHVRGRDPLVLYAVWYARWGQRPPSHPRSTHREHSRPTCSTAWRRTRSLLGLGASVHGRAREGQWGRPLLLALFLAAAIRIRVGWGPSSLVLGLGGGARLLLALTAANSAISRPPVASRYQYIGAILLLLVASRSRGPGPPRPHGDRNRLCDCRPSVRESVPAPRVVPGSAGVTPAVRGGLSGLEIASDRVNPSLVLTQENSGFNYVGSITAGPYLSAADVRLSGLQRCRAAHCTRESARLGRQCARHRPGPEARTAPGAPCRTRLLGSPAALIRASRGCLLRRPALPLAA